MSRLSRSILLIFSVLLLCAPVVFAEDITITTYYPSPYGSYKNLNVYNRDESTTQTDFTQALTKAGLYITTDYTDNAYTPGIFWSTQNDNATKPKAGIYLNEANLGTRIYFGTSNNYVTGITNNAMVINESGYVGIGRLPTTYNLEVEGNASKTAAGAWLANSDRRIKTDITNIDNAVSILSLLRPVKFKYTDEYKKQHPSITDKYYYNFIAQEFQQVFPSEVIVTNDTLSDGEHILAIDPYVVTPYLVKAIQEQQGIIKAQQVEVDGLKARLDKLEGKQAPAGK